MGSSVNLDVVKQVKCYVSRLGVFIVSAANFIFDINTAKCSSYRGAYNAIFGRICRADSADMIVS